MRMRGELPGAPATRVAIATLPPLDRGKQVMEALADYVERAALKSGDRLPTERELMAALSVGRSTIREAMGRFEALGVTETRKGSGTYLLKPISAGTIHLPLSLDTAELRDGLLHTLEVRRGIEAEASMVAARRRTVDDLRTIEEKLIEMERVHLATGTSGPEDLAFHLAVYDATHNPLFRQLLGQMREAFERFWDHPFDRQDFARRSFPYHRELFDAIVAGDAELARGKTLKILEIVEEDIEEMSK
jgi:GntR family transcriptional regulator, transcriptional repressor for pyruvate dehydrogenase complex